jgi:hypothetical protein
MSAFLVPSAQARLAPAMKEIKTMSNSLKEFAVGLMMVLAGMCPAFAQGSNSTQDQPASCHENCGVSNHGGAIILNGSLFGGASVPARSRNSGNSFSYQAHSVSSPSVSVANSTANSLLPQQLRR